MKRVLSVAGLAMALVAATTQSSAAQDMSKPTWSIYGGLNMSTVEGPEVPDAKYKLGYLAGVGVGFKMSEAISLNIEGQFTSKGVKFSDSDGEGTVSVSFIEIPALIRFNAAPLEGGARFFGLAGGFVAAKMSCNIEFKGQGFTVSSSCEDADFQIESMDFGATLGGGIEFKSGNRAWALGLRYDLGLQNLNKNSDSSAKSRSIALVLSVGM